MDLLNFLPLLWIQTLWIIEAHFGIRVCLKYMKLYMNRKKNLLDFHCFLLHRKILNTFEVIALLYYWMQIYFVATFWSIFASFSPDIQWRVAFLTVLLLLVLILWKNHKTVQSSHIWQKRLKETPKNGQNDQISRIFGISRQNLGRTNSKSI